MYLQCIVFRGLRTCCVVEQEKEVLWLQSFFFNCGHVLLLFYLSTCMNKCPTFNDFFPG